VDFGRERLYRAIYRVKLDADGTYTHSLLVRWPYVEYVDNERVDIRVYDQCVQVQIADIFLNEPGAVYSITSVGEVQWSIDHSLVDPACMVVSNTRRRR